MATELLTTTGAGTWTCPAGVTSVIVECWGGGGGGGTASGNPATGGGGAGGAYSKKTISVTPSTVYNINVGAGGTAAAVGGDSWFSSSSTVIAKGGAGGATATGNSTNGAGGTGSSASCIGDVVYAGGNGGTGNYTSGVGGSGGGGGAARVSSDGESATGETSGNGLYPAGGGGMGVGNSTAGAVGAVYGGGGSGGKANNNTDRVGGIGAQGLIRLTYTYPYPKFTNVSNITATTSDASLFAFGSTISYESTSVYVMIVMFTGSDDPGAVTGSMGWYLVDSVGDATRRISIFRCKPSSSSSSKPNFSNSGTVTGCAARIYQVQDCTTTGYQGENAFLQVVTQSSTTSANPSITMNTLAPRSSVISCFVGSAAFSGSVEGGWTEENDASISTPTAGFYTMLREDTTDNTPSFTAASSTWIGVAIEFTNTTAISGAIGQNAVAGTYSERERDGNYQNISASGNTSGGQAFTSLQSGVLKSAKFYLYKLAAPTGSAYAKLYASSGTMGSTAKPTGAALATSNAFDVSTLSTTDAALKEFTFPAGTSITAGTDYCIALEYTGGDSTNIVRLGYNFTSETHPGNKINYSGTWSSDSGSDVHFYVYVDGPALATVSGTLTEGSPGASTSATVTTSGTLIGSGALACNDTDTLATVSAVIIGNALIVSVPITSLATVDATGSATANITGQITEIPATVSGTVLGTGSLVSTPVTSVVTTSGVLIGAGLMLGRSIPTPSLADSYVDTFGTNLSLNGTATEAGQVFTAPSSGAVLSCKLYLQRTNSPVGNVYVKLYTSQGIVGTSGKPDTLLCTSDGMAASSVSTTSTLYEFTFTTSPATINAGVGYCLMVSYESGTSTDYIRQKYNTTTASHSGNYCHKTSGVYTANSAADAPFELYIGNSATVSGTLIDEPSNELEANISASTTTSGILTGTGVIVGTVTSSGSVDGVLIGSGELISTGQATSTVTAVLRADILATATDAGQFTTSGILVGTATLVSTPVSQTTTTSGVLLGSGRLISTPVTSIATTSAALGKLMTPIIITSVATVSGIMIGSGALISTPVTSTSTVSAALGKLIDGSITVTITTSAALGKLMVSTTVISVVTTGGPLTANGRLISTPIASTSSVTGILGGNVYAVTSINASSTVSGSIVGLVQAVGSISVVTTVADTIMTGLAVVNTDGSTSTTSTGSGTVVGTGALVVNIVANATNTATISQIVDVSTLTNLTSTASATLIATLAFVGSSSGTSTGSGLLGYIVLIQGDIFSGTFVMGRMRSESATMQGTDTVQSIENGVLTGYGSMFANTELTALVSGVSGGATTLAGSSSLQTVPSAVINAGGRLRSTLISATTDTTGALLQSRNISSSVTATETVTGSLQAAGNMSGSTNLTTLTILISEDVPEREIYNTP